MASLRSKPRDELPSGGSGRSSSGTARAVGWIAFAGAGVSLAAWSLASMAGAYSAAATLTAQSSFLQTIPAPAGIAFADPQMHFVRTAMPQPAFVPADGVVPEKLAATVAETGKSARLIASLASARKRSVESSAARRFDHVVAEAALSPQKLTAAFARSGLVKKTSIADAAPLKERFYQLAALDEPAESLATRFGPRTVDPERSSRLALALAGESQVEIAYAVAAPLASDAAGDDIVVAPDFTDEASLESDVPSYETLPDSIPLPGFRPRQDRNSSRQSDRILADKPAGRPASPKPAEKTPSRRSNQSGEMLAFAKPDTPSGGLGQAFRNLFNSPGTSSSARAGDGVAVYEISTATVIMPDGTRLEAHSGMGHMADNARYADQRMHGPTPPGTYQLTMRESRFHGVEAIRLTPVNGKNPYGRNGLLAHTEMLRGRPEQSNGCVAFKNYDRFLKAFKRGKIKRLVVVPGRSHRSPDTTVADNSRGA